MLAATLVSIHNLTFFSTLLAAIRQAIADGDLTGRADAWLARMSAEADPLGNV